MMSDKQSSKAVLHSVERTILERAYMEYRPFGVDERGARITDVSGMIVLDNVEFLKACASRRESDGAATSGRVVEELCRLLNQRIRDSAYHVTPGLLTNVWNSYSYEFVCFLREFCRQLSGDPRFHFNVGSGKHISPLIQTLGRPFSVAQIYRMYPYFAEKYTKGSTRCTVEEVTDHSAILRLQFTERTLHQFGSYRKACAYQVCESAKGRLSMVPASVHHLPAATVKDRSCIANGDEWCEWEVTWLPHRPWNLSWPTWGLLAAGMAIGYLHLFHPGVRTIESVALVLAPAIVSWLATSRRVRKHADRREAVIQEQVKLVEVRHEELRETYVDQEQIRVELRRKVNQLTALHRAGLLFNSTLDRETLLQNVLETLLRDLHYDRAMISFYDPVRRVTYDARILGVPESVQRVVRSRDIPIDSPDSLEGQVILQGKPILIDDIQEIRHKVHPLNRQLAELTRTQTLLSVPLKTKDRILGAILVDRAQQHSLTADDLDLMVTVANQVAIALDNASAYRQIEDMNLGLEAKVRERTLALEKADRMRSLFLSHVSHELKTPLTSIKGFVDNMLGGLAGPLSGKQHVYLERTTVNVDRLIRMIEDLLDRTRIETGKLDISPTEVSLRKCVADVYEQLRPLAATKRQRLEASYPDSELIVWGDADRLIQIFTNLIQNAIKFTHDEGEILVRVVQDSPQFAAVAVCDTGPGIPPDAMGKIFDPFFRVEHGPKGGPKGLGLGLSITKTFVELHGGTISVRSELGKGTEFYCTLPLRPALDAAQPAKANGRRLLVADDDPDIRQLLSDRLHGYGYVVKTAIDGSHALKLLASEAFDGVILDIGMPDMDGLEVLRRIREWNLRLPVIMVTASGTKDRAVQAMGMGAQGYVLKPFDPAELQQVVEYWIGGTS